MDRVIGPSGHRVIEPSKQISPRQPRRYPRLERRETLRLALRAGCGVTLAVGFLSHFLIPAGSESLRDGEIPGARDG